MMTRKDYVTTAEILNYHLNSNTQDSCTEIIKDFAVYFEEDNPRFQSKRFMEAVLGK